MMTNGDHEGQIFFLSHPHTNKGFFFLLTINTSYILEKHEKSFQKIPNTLRCDMVASFYHCNDVMDRRVAEVRLFIFYLSLGLVRVCEIELSHMGNPDLVCEKSMVFFTVSPETLQLAYTKNRK